MTLRGAWARTVRSAPRAFILGDARSGTRATRADIQVAASNWAAAQTRELTGRRVAFCVENGLAWWEVFLGILARGGVAVPLDNAEVPGQRLALARSVDAELFWDGKSLVPTGVEPRRRERSACVVKVTSGSTGRPRALAFTDSEMLADGRQVCRGMCIQKTDTNFALIPLGHSYGLGNLVIPFLAHGIPLVCGSSPFPQVVADEIARWRPSVFPAVPAILQGLARAEVAAAKLESLRAVISAGAPLAPELAAEFQRKFGRTIHNFYGSSETGGIAYCAGVPADPRAVGWLLPGVKFRAHRGGRFVISSPAVFTLGNPRRHGRIGAYLPADLGRMHGRELVLHGRVGRTVKISGKRLDLSEVENRLRQLPGVTDARVFFRDQPREELAAAIATGHSLPEVRELARQNLAAWKIPRSFLILAQLPTTARGKVDRDALEQLLWRKPKLSQ